MNLRKYLPSILALGISLAAIVLLIFFGSADPARGLSAFFLGPISRTYQLGNMLDSASYILIAGLGILLAFRGGSFNLGGEGQAYAGAFSAGILLSTLPSGLGAWGIVLGLLAATLTGAVLASFSGILRRYLGVNELISSYLLSLGLIPVFDALISGPLRDQSSNLLTTVQLAPEFHLPKILAPSNLNLSVLVALVLLVGMVIVLRRTRIGFELRMTGSNPVAARASGVPAGLYAFLAFLVSGALHGLAGGLAVTGTYHAALVGVTSGVGWNGIAAALIGRNNPWGTLWGAVFFAYLQAGSKAAMIHTRFSSELAVLVQAIVFLLITVEFSRSRRSRLGNS